jgi:hypothetical protein
MRIGRLGERRRGGTAAVAYRSWHLSRYFIFQLPSHPITSWLGHWQK